VAECILATTTRPGECTLCRHCGRCLVHMAKSPKRDGCAHCAEIPQRQVMAELPSVDQT